nr:hypothetical protein [Sedimentibacter sp.]
MLTLNKRYERIISKGLVALDYENSNFGNTSNFESNNKINNIKISKDGQSRISDRMSNVLNSGLSSVINRENTQIKEKKIVNNKPSQFGPILGVNFHNVKK